MNQELRAAISEALAAAGLAGFKDTTTAMRPQWRASFSHTGQFHGEKSYIHVYVPAGADQLQVNSTAPADVLDTMPTDRFREELAAITTACAPGTETWARLLSDLGADPGEVVGWEAATVPHMGIQHRMVLARVTMPLDALSSRSLDMGVRLGLSLARLARDAIAAVWEQPREEE